MSVVDRQGRRLSAENARFTADLFPGFLRALRACQIGWDDVNIEGPLAPSNVVSRLSLIFLSGSC